MKKLVLMLSLPFMLNAFSAKAEDVNKEAKSIIKEFISNEGRSLSLPKEGKKKFYTYCSTVQIAIIVGHETGKCLSLSLDSDGNLDYISTRLRNWKVSWGATVGVSENNLHRIRGIKSLNDINGFYLIASSGAGWIGNVRENWFTLKLSFKDLAGNTPEMDGGVPVLNAGIDIISLGLMQYKDMPGAKIQRTKL